MSNAPINGVCHYCGDTKKLAKAHIIPRSFYEHDWSPKGPPRLFSNKAGQSHPKRLPIGAYDTSILCVACDGKLGELDQHAAEQILPISARTRLNFPSDPRAIAFEYQEARAEKIYRFALSVLWRASISRLDMFDAVSLARYDSEILQILRKSLDEQPHLSVNLAEFSDNKIALLNPHQTRFDGVRFWVVYANRFAFYIRTDKRPLPTCFEGWELQRGRVVQSVHRDWDNSQERRVASNVVAAAPYNPFRPSRNV